ncbi:MAG: class I SAM-dependent methyltransferase [Calditrichaeota bacterium]|nr:class I SAM-dependent methyltransferase [Calditrichota bacterium]
MNSKEISKRFVHPISKELLLVDQLSNLYASDRPDEVLFENLEGSYDFVLHGESLGDRAYYNHNYDGLSALKTPKNREGLKKEWLKKATGFKELLQRVGDVNGKRMLLIGNGKSQKEFLFSLHGANVTFTDLSITGVTRMKDLFARSEFAEQYSDSIEFHAVNALQLPFPRESFDIIYACAFVHHIQDLDKLFNEIAVCLKAQGRCIFLDDSNSSIWHTMKATILWPLKKYTHWRKGISPEDKVATKKGGFTKREIELLMDKHGFKKLMFDRISYFEYLVKRATVKLDLPFMRFLQPIAISLDNYLERRYGFISRQGIRLVWGFEK